MRLKPLAKIGLPVGLIVAAAWVATVRLGPAKLQAQLMIAETKNIHGPSKLGFSVPLLPDIAIEQWRIVVPLYFEATSVVTWHDSYRGFYGDAVGKDWGYHETAAYLYTPWRVYRLKVHAHTDFSKEENDPGIARFAAQKSAGMAEYHEALARELAGIAELKKKQELALNARGPTDESPQLVREYMAQTGYEEITSLINGQLVVGVKQDVQRFSPAEQEQVFQLLDTQILSGGLLALNLDRLNPGDLRTLLEFYRTPTGKGIARKHADARIALHRAYLGHSKDETEGVLARLRASLTAEENRALETPALLSAFVRLAEAEDKPDFQTALKKINTEWIYRMRVLTQRRVVLFYLDKKWEEERLKARKRRMTE